MRGGSNPNSWLDSPGLARNYEILFESLPDLCRLVNSEGKIIDCNATYLSALGYSKEEIIGATIFDHSPEENHPGLETSLGGWKRGDIAKNTMIWMKRKDGSRFQALLNSAIVDDGSGNLIRITVIKDVAEFQSSQDRLEKTSKLLSLSEQKYRSLYDKSPVMLRTITVEGILTDCNDEYVEKMGYTREEAIGKTIYDFTAEISKQALMINMDRWKTTHEISNNEIWCKRKDGSIFPVLLAGTSLYDEQQNLIGRTLALTDLTDIYEARKKLEHDEAQLRGQFEQLETAHKLLISTEQKYRTLYDKSPVMLRTINREGILEDCNESYAESLGYTKDEAVGMSMYDHTAEKSIPELRENLENWHKNQNIKPAEVWMKRKDGSIFPAHFTGGSLLDEKGGLIGRTVALTDMTEVHAKKIEEEKTKKLMAVGELSSRIAHDIRNPLSVIKSTVNVMRLKYPDDNEETREKFSRIDRAIARISHQIDEVLDYVKPKALKLKENRMGDIFRNSLERIVIPDTVKVACQDSDIRLVCDMEKLEVVFTNLITNAIQAMDYQGQVTLQAMEEDGLVNIEVEDCGPGIPEEQVGKIFDPLFTTKMVGTGLGLTSCKRIVESHGGRIAIKNTGPKGTTFLVSLPRNLN